MRVDNNAQPNSRWYTGSGIYRNVWLVATSPVYVDHWGTFVTTPEVSEKSATVKLEVKIRNKSQQNQEIWMETEIFDQHENLLASAKTDKLLIDSFAFMNQQIKVESPQLWSVENPALYNAVTKIYADGKLADMVLRDRNHPSVFMWSIGNEIREQFDTTGIRIGKELVGIVKKLDSTRPVTSGMTEQDPAKNYIYLSRALDLISFNYKHLQYLDFPKNYPGEKLLAAENMSAFATRGHYDMPSDSVRFWPEAYNLPLQANPDLTASSYDNCHAYWGATHEETWKVIKNNDFVSGMFVWSGFDFLGEPEPYPWPARSSYYGIIDLAGFPKDIYYFYQSEWTSKPVLHLFPHWNWNEGQLIDVWAYYNTADEVELFLNGESQGVRSKTADQFHAMWRLKYKAGAIKAISRKNGKTVLEKEIYTAGIPAKIELIADRTILNADGKDLSFITVKITDEAGNMVPNAANLINFRVSGNGFIAGVDNGCQTSMEPFKAEYRKAFNGMCLLIVQTGKKAGKIKIEATSEGLMKAELRLETGK